MMRNGRLFCSSGLGFYLNRHAVADTTGTCIDRKMPQLPELPFHRSICLCRTLFPLAAIFSAFRPCVAIGCPQQPENCRNPIS